MYKRDIVLKLLRNGKTVSKLTAITHGIGNVAEEVRQLRNRGYPIRTVYSKTENGTRYTEYKLSAR